MKTNSNVTLEELIEKSEKSVTHAINYAENQYVEYFSKPVKPVLKKDANSKEVLEYAKNLSEWEILIDNCKKANNEVDKINSEIRKTIEEFIKHVSGFSNVPEKYRDKVYSLAYEKGHSSGYYEVYLELTELVEIFID